MLENLSGNTASAGLFVGTPDPMVDKDSLAEGARYTFVVHGESNSHPETFPGFLFVRYIEGFADGGDDFRTIVADADDTTPDVRAGTRHAWNSEHVVEIRPWEESP